MLITSCYTLIYVAQANAQIKTLGEETQEVTPPLLIKNETLIFDDLIQIPESIKVSHVIDGKTFVGYDDVTYMLASLDSNLNEGHYARQGKDLLEELIKEQTLILFRTKNPVKKRQIGRQNRMGHIIVHAIRQTDTTWIQGTLIANGLARVRTTAFNPEQALKLLTQEQDARANKRGLWTEEAYRVLTSEDAHNHIGAFHIVEGTIKSAAIVRNKVYLNFGDSWKTDFTIGIEGKIRRDLSHKNIDTLTWAGQRVRIHGWVRSYNGPYIELTHLEQIEILADDKK